MQLMLLSFNLLFATHNVLENIKRKEKKRKTKIISLASLSLYNFF